MIASFSAVDADSVEGGYYLWESETLQDILTRKEYRLLTVLWGLEGHAEFSAGHLPRVQMSLDEAASQLQTDKNLAQKQYQSAREKLLDVRARRNLPVDDKLLAAWNGLALTVLIEAAKLPGGEKYRDAAKGVRDYLLNTLWDGQRLLRARGKQGQAGLEDHAFVAQGLLAWAELTNSDADFRLAARWVNDAWQRFYSDTGWLLSDQTLLPRGFGVAMLNESPLASPSSTLLKISLKVAQRRGDRMLIARTKQALTTGHTQLQQAAFDYPSQVILLAEQNLTNP